MEEKSKWRASSIKEPHSGSFYDKDPKRKKLKTIALIDDDEISNFIAGSLLENMKVAEKVLSFLSAGDALQFFVKEDPSRLPELILLDINMPGMDGFQFIEEYHNLFDTHQRAVIAMFLTTSLNEEECERAQKYDNVVAQFIHKPLTEKAVNGLINQFFV